MSFIPAGVEGGVWMSRAEKKEKCAGSSSVCKFSKERMNKRWCTYDLSIEYAVILKGSVALLVFLCSSTSR